MHDVSAFIAAVPEAEPFVSELRAAHDPSAADGVPAHVTLLHPFRPAAMIDSGARALAARIAARTAPFALSLARIARFPGVLYLAPQPAEPFVALTRALTAAFPDHPPYAGRHPDVVPHLTVAQGAESLLDEAQARLREALPPGGIAARCTELVLIANDRGRWRRVAAWAFGSCRSRIAGHGRSWSIPMTARRGEIVGHVTYREGDGQELVIPPGACDITVTHLDVTITWVDGDTRGSTALPLAEYTRFLTSGAIRLVD